MSPGTGSASAACRSRVASCSLSTCHSSGVIITVAAVATSEAGAVLFRTGFTPLLRQFVWFDRDGKELEKVGEPDEGFPMSPAFSPDRRQIVTHRQHDGNMDIWTLDLARGSLSRFTTHPANEIQPLWSRQGDRIIFTSGDHMEKHGATNTLRLLQIGMQGQAEGLGEL